MSCEGYQEKLVETLAAGEGALGGELAAHVRVCVACREFYEAQVHLFGAIDSGVRAMVSEEIPPSLLPGVRARVEEVPIAHTWLPWLMPAAVVVIVAVLMLSTLVRHRSQANNVQVAFISQNERNGSDTAQPVVLQPGSLDAPFVIKRRTIRLPASRTVAQPATPPGNVAVVIDPKEARGLQKLAETACKRPQWAMAMAHPVQFPLDELGPIHPLEFPNLEVKPLQDENE
jgi:hypothetical protein